jgi:hypothetical protein
MAPRDTPRNEVAYAANALTSAYGIWARAWNAMQSGSVDLAEAEAWEPIMRLANELNRRRTAWIRGNR